MGLVLDIVPNHMAASAENPWWMDVLENGRDSIYSHHFAIDWDRACVRSTGRNRVVLPILGEPYGAVLDNGQFGLKLDENGFFVKYFEHRLPLDPKSYRLILESSKVAGLQEVVSLLEAIDELPSGNLDADARCERHRLKEQLKERLWRLYSDNAEIKAAIEEHMIAIDGIPGDAGSFDLLDRILSRQSYRVAYWRMAGEELNYRRFFDITDLIGIRVEDPDVFDSRHPEIVGLVERRRSDRPANRSHRRLVGSAGLSRAIEAEGARRSSHSGLRRILRHRREDSRFGRGDAVRLERLRDSGYDFLAYLNNTIRRYRGSQRA